MSLGDEKMFHISDLAKELGITNRTIRLYENMGLVPPPRRTEGRYRCYEKMDIVRFKFVLKLKALGLSLDEMQELAEIYDKESKATEKVMPHLVDLLDIHLKKIRQKISVLDSLEKDINDYRQKIVSQKCYLNT